LVGLRKAKTFLRLRSYIPEVIFKGNLGNPYIPEVIFKGNLGKPYIPEVIFKGNLGKPYIPEVIFKGNLGIEKADKIFCSTHKFSSLNSSYYSQGYLVFLYCFH